MEKKKRTIREFSTKDKLSIAIVNLWEDLKIFDFSWFVIVWVYSMFCSRVLLSAGIVNFLLPVLTYLSSGTLLGKMSKKQGGLFWEALLLSILNEYMIAGYYRGAYCFVTRYVFVVVLLYVGIRIGKSLRKQKVIGC